jgi:hypothetical protein
VVVGDVLSDAAFVPYRDIVQLAGFRAVQSTPLLSSRSALVGIVSTHFSTTHTPTVRELAALKEIGCFAADAIIAHRAHGRLKPPVSSAVQRETEKAEEYRHCAAECKERALNSEGMAVMRQFVELAQRWSELADQLDRGDVN